MFSCFLLIKIITVFDDDLAALLSVVSYHTVSHEIKILLLSITY